MSNKIQRLRPASLASGFPSLQHVFVMFGATVLVPLLTQVSVLRPPCSPRDRNSGDILITQGKVPAYLGSSFAFIPPLIAVSANYGVEYALGGAFCVGFVYLLIGGIIRLFGLGWMDRFLSPVVIGSVIVTIGLNLAPTAMSMAMNDATGAYNGYFVLVAVVTLAIAVVAAVLLRGFFTVIPVLLGIVGGYVRAGRRMDLAQPCR